MNSFGNIFKINLYGTSHNECFGVLIDGIPAGIKIDLDKMQEDLNKRKPASCSETARVEADLPKIKSGLYNGYTNGTPLVIEFANDNVKSSDYDMFKATPRPSQVDFVGEKKYKGFADLRGSGQFSGRMTAALVAAGSVAKEIAHYAYQTEIVQVGSETDKNKFDEILNSLNGDSIGGIVQVRVNNLPVGLGEPYFYSVESAISHILYSIGGVKGVDFGIGFRGVSLKGSEFNDPIIDREGHTKTNNAGGVVGGITNGNELVVNVFVKPIASISLPQNTYNFKEEKMDVLEIKGRHDSSILRRIQIVLENAIAIALADLVLINKIYE